MSSLEGLARKFVEPDRITDPAREKLKSLYVYVAAIIVLGVLRESAQITDAEIGPAMLTVVLLGAAKATEFATTLFVSNRETLDGKRMKEYFPTAAATAFAISITYYPKLIQTTIAVLLFTLVLHVAWLLDKQGEDDNDPMSRISSIMLSVMVVGFSGLLAVLVILGVVWTAQQFSVI